MITEKTRYKAKKKRYIGKTLVHIYDTIDSTSTEAKRYTHNVYEPRSIDPEKISQLKNGVVFISDSQTKGKGSFSKSWISEKGGLYYSLLLETSIDIAQDLSYYVQKLRQISVSTTGTVTDTPIEGRDPNDLYIGYKKVGGLLLETFAINNKQFIIIGLGLNLNQKAFPRELTYIATSLNLIYNKTYNRVSLIKSLTHHYLDFFKKEHPSFNP